MVEHNLLMDECGTFATLHAAISVVVQMNQFITYMRPNFEHGIPFLLFVKNGHVWL